MLLLGFIRDKVSLVAIVFFSSTYSFCHDRSFFGYLTIYLGRFVVLCILCHDNLMCDYWNSYVATSIIVSQQCLCAAPSNWCRDLVFMSRQHVCLVSCCNNVSCIISISVSTRKVCRDRVLLSLPDFLLQLHFDLAT